MDSEQLGALLQKTDVHYHSAAEFLESLPDSTTGRKMKYAGFTALRMCDKAIDYAPEDERQQVIQNALLYGNYNCIKKMGIERDWKESGAETFVMEKFVIEKVLPYLPVFETDGRYSLDEKVMLESLANIGGDYRQHLRQELELLDSGGYNDPIKKLLFANYTGDKGLIKKYDFEAAEWPERDKLERTLAENGIKVQRIIQAGDVKRYYPKDGFIFEIELSAGKDRERLTLKELLRQHTDCSRLDGISCEEKILQQLSHDNIVNYRGCVNIEGHDFMLMEYIESKQKGNGSASVMQELHDITDAYMHMKSRGVLYLDFKAKNIMHNGSTKIVDFGWAQLRRNVNYTALSTPRYIVPETLLTGKADEKSDVFALGIYIFERLTGKHPFTDVHLPQHRVIPSWIHYGYANTANSVNTDAVIDPTKHVGEQMRSLICDMLEKKPENRIGWEEIQEMI